MLTPTSPASACPLTGRRCRRSTWIRSSRRCERDKGGFRFLPAYIIWCQIMAAYRSDRQWRCLARACTAGTDCATLGHCQAITGQAACMPRKLKAYKTSIGFFDLAIAAPSMKAAAEAWGSDPDIFKRGFAEETDDPRIVEATMATPGVVLRRPVGSNDE